MTANLGNVDRFLWVILGLVPIVAPLLKMPKIWANATLAYGSIALGLVFVTTVFFRFCPLYRIAGLSTCRT